MNLDDQRAGDLTGEGLRRLTAGGQRIVITGAGGWLGLATLELLHRALGAAFFERVACFGSAERTLTLRGGLRAPQQALQRIGALPSRPSLVLHLAFLTKDRAETMVEADYVAANRAVSQTVLAALGPIGATAVFVPSSGAATQALDPSAPAAARLYGRLKLDDEAAFADWARQAGARAVIARVFNLSGPYINKVQSYALAAFILDALAGRPIAIKASRPVFRSYVAISELVSIVFGLLTESEAGVTALDTAGERALEMREIAEAVQRALDRPVAIERAPMIDQAADIYVGDRTAYERLVRAYGVSRVDFPSQIRQTAAYLDATHTDERLMSRRQGQPAQ